MTHIRLSLRCWNQVNSVCGNMVHSDAKSRDVRVQGGFHSLHFVADNGWWTGRCTHAMHRPTRRWSPSTSIWYTGFESARSVTDSMRSVLPVFRQQPFTYPSFARRHRGTPIHGLEWWASACFPGLSGAKASATVFFPAQHPRRVADQPAVRLLYPGVRNEQPGAGSGSVAVAVQRLSGVCQTGMRWCKGKLGAGRILADRVKNPIKTPCPPGGKLADRVQGWGVTSGPHFGFRRTDFNGPN